MFTPTEFWLYEAVGDSQVVSGDGLSVDHPEQGEFGRQRVHDHGQVSLSNLRTEMNSPPEVSLFCGGSGFVSIPVLPLSSSAFVSAVHETAFEKLGPFVSVCRREAGRRAEFQQQEQHTAFLLCGDL